MRRALPSAGRSSGGLHLAARHSNTHSVASIARALRCPNGWAHAVHRLCCAHVPHARPLVSSAVSERFSRARMALSVPRCAVPSGHAFKCSCDPCLHRCDLAKVSVWRSWTQLVFAAGAGRARGTLLVPTKSVSRSNKSLTCSRSLTGLPLRSRKRHSSCSSAYSVTARAHSI